jgi:teichuronic acid biosynthesis protein TuaE
MTYLPRIPQIIFGMIASVILGWVSFTYLPAVSFRLFIAACIGCTVGLLFVIQYRQSFWKHLSLPHFMLSLMLATSFLGSALFTVSVGPITLFPYRLVLVFLAAILFIKFMKKEMSLTENIQIPFVYLFLLIWIIYSILALSWVADLTSALKEVITLITGIMVIFFVTYLFKKEENYLEFFTIWIVMGFLLIGLGFINHFLQFHLSISRITHAYAYQKGIPTSVFVNENDFGSFLGITAFFFLSLIKNGKKILYQMVGLFGFLSCIALILITESRANYIGVFLGCLFWFVFLLSRKQKLWITCSALVVAPILALWQLSRVLKVWELLKTQIDSLIVPQIGKSSVDIRSHLLKNAKVYIENTFGFGVGPGNIEYYMRNVQKYDTFQNYNPHNWWAEIFAQYGFLIFTGYILMFFFLFVSLWRLWKKQIHAGNSLISEALICGMVSFVMASISPNSFIALNYNWIFIAFVIAYINFHYKENVYSGGRK